MPFAVHPAPHHRLDGLLPSRHVLADPTVRIILVSDAIGRGRAFGAFVRDLAQGDHLARVEPGRRR